MQLVFSEIPERIASKTKKCYKESKIVEYFSNYPTLPHQALKPLLLGHLPNVSLLKTD